LGISLVFATVIPEIVLYYMNRFKKHSKPNSDHLNEVMFFTDKGIQCKDCYKRLICEKEFCSYRNVRYNYQKLLLIFNYSAFVLFTVPVILTERH